MQWYYAAFRAVGAFRSISVRSIFHLVLCKRYSKTVVLGRVKNTALDLFLYVESVLDPTEAERHGLEYVREVMNFHSVGE